MTNCTSRLHWRPLCSHTGIQLTRRHLLKRRTVSRFVRDILRLAHICRVPVQSTYQRSQPVRSVNMIPFRYCFGICPQGFTHYVGCQGILMQCRESFSGFLSRIPPFKLLVNTKVVVFSITFGGQSSTSLGSWRTESQVKH